jgi:aspartyl-tRNA(Asn)/glutamyl-tRNA(Gln) amidotransferase subunit C
LTRENKIVYWEIASKTYKKGGLKMKKKHLSKKEVEHVAWLAHIELTEQEKTVFTEQFNEILDYFKKIDEIETRGIEQTSHVLELNNVFRKDEIKPPLSTEQALKNAAKKQKKFYKAPTIV